MNEALVRNWNAVVTPDDTAIVVGDFSLAFRPVELYTNRLMGHKTLVHGNHDFTHPAHKKSKNKENQDKWIQKYIENGWEQVLDSMVISLDGIDGLVNVAHLPYLGDNTDNRYDKYRLIDDGKTLLCGHVHEKWKTKRTKKGTLMVNVGVDVWNYSPVSETELVKLILDSN
jgi:calcineurin-like phosphoesterase family protein